MAQVQKLVAQSYIDNIIHTELHDKTGRKRVKTNVTCYKRRYSPAPNPAPEDRDVLDRQCEERKGDRGLILNIN